MRIKSIILLIVFFIICSCKKAKEKNKPIEKNDTRIIVVGDSIKSKPKEGQIITHKNTPIPELIEFVKEIEKTNWVPDTLRLRKKRLYEYLGKKTLFSGYPFYEIEYLNTDLKRANELRPELLKRLSKNINIELFKNTKSIWGYFYRDKNGGNTISDGIIEQWEFENEEEAKKALEQIKPAGHFVYFNTMPFHCRIKNYLITFRTRAMGFSYEQKKIFEEFKTKNCT